MLARQMSSSERSYHMSRSVCLAPSIRFLSLSLSAITVSHSLPRSTGRQTLKSFLIMRQTTEKRLQLFTHTNAHTSMHAQTRAWSRHTHGETCTQVTWLRKGYVKSINIKRNANGWLSLKVYICLCVFVFVCVDPHLFMSLTVVKIPNILWRSRMKEIPLLN